MPTSDMRNIPAIVRKATEIQPKRVMDLGVGAGKYGALLREYLDINSGNIRPSDWKVWIEGYEGFKEYENPSYGMYNLVRFEDFSRAQIMNFDLVLMIDSLEHLNRDVGTYLLSRLLQANKHVIVSVPDCTERDYPQGAWGGNDYETHRASWTAADLLGMGGKIIHRDVCVVAYFNCAFRGY